MKIIAHVTKKAIYIGPSSITKIMFDLAFELNKNKSQYVSEGPKSKTLEDLKSAYEDLSYAFSEIMKALSPTVSN
jgi:hypothetical protein